MLGPRCSTVPWTTGVTETNGELCRQYQKSAASAPTGLNDRLYQKLLTDLEGLEQLGHCSRQPGEYLRALAGQQFRQNDPVENQIGEAEGGQSATDTPSVDEQQGVP